MRRVALAAGSDDEEHFQKKNRARLARDKLRLNPVVLGDALFCSCIDCDHNDIAGAILSSMLPTKTQLLVWQNQLNWSYTGQLHSTLTVLYLLVGSLCLLRASFGTFEMT